MKIVFAFVSSPRGEVVNLKKKNTHRTQTGLATLLNCTDTVMNSKLFRLLLNVGLSALGHTSRFVSLQGGFGFVDLYL
jgi:hypothetical protein